MNYFDLAFAIVILWMSYRLEGVRQDVWLMQKPRRPWPRFVADTKPEWKPLERPARIVTMPKVAMRKRRRA